MEKHVFITPAGLTYKPNCDSPEPEHIDIQIFGYEQNESIQDTVNDLIELNQGNADDRLDRPFSVRIENRRRQNFWDSEKSIRPGMAG